MNAVVTPIENVQLDSEGNFVTDDEGNLLLHNEDDLGFLTKVHITQVNQVENGMIVSGISTLAEVYWNLRRNPSPALVSPNDIAWVTLDANEDDDDYEEIESDFVVKAGEAEYDDEDELDH